MGARVLPKQLQFRHCNQQHRLKFAYETVLAHPPRVVALPHTVWSRPEVNSHRVWCKSVNCWSDDGQPTRVRQRKVQQVPNSARGVRVFCTGIGADPSYSDGTAGFEKSLLGALNSRLALTTSFSSLSSLWIRLEPFSPSHTVWFLQCVNSHGASSTCTGVPRS